MRGLFALWSQKDNTISSGKWASNSACKVIPQGLKPEGILQRYRTGLKPVPFKSNSNCPTAEPMTYALAAHSEGSIWAKTLSWVSISASSVL